MMASAQVVDLTSDNSPTSAKAVPNTPKSTVNSSKSTASTNNTSKSSTTTASAKSTNTSNTPATSKKSETNGLKQESATQTPQPQTGADAAWTESDYTNALASLDSLHDQINTLRNAIPHMISTFAAPHPSPASLATSFEALAKASTSDMRGVRTAWMSEGVQRALNKAKARSEELGGVGAVDEALPVRSATGDGWEVVDFAEGTNGDKNGVKVDVKTASSEDEDWDNMDLDDDTSENDTSREGLARVIEKFQLEHPAVRVDVDEDARSMKVSVPVPGRPLEFTILQQQQPQGVKGGRGDGGAKGTVQYAVSCRGSSRLCSAISRSLKVNPFKNDLGYILELIASYANIQTAKCVVCHTILDDNAMLPVTRKLKAIKDAETGVVQKQWVALHDYC